MTFLAALRHDRIDAPWFIEGPIDGESFRLYMENILVPTLRPGDIVVMDNLGSHKGKIVRQLIRSAGAKLFFLPKYSPDLNPIEQVFAKLKHLLRKLAARTADAVCAAIRETLQALHARRMRQLSHKLRLSKIISSRSSSPNAAPATPVSAAAAKQQYQYDDNQDQFHRKSPLIVAASLAAHCILQSADGVLHRACGLVGLSFVLQLLIAEDLADGFLHGALGLLCRTFNFDLYS